MQPPLPPENAIVIFSDGAQATVKDGQPAGINDNGEPMTVLILRPTDNMMILNQIKLEELDRGQDLIFNVPSKYIIPLNPFSQTNKTWLIMCDYRKKHTDLTKFFFCEKCGKGYPNVFDSLRAEEVKSLAKDIQISKLTSALKKASETLEIGLSKKTMDEIIDEISSRVVKRMDGGKSGQE